MGIKRKNSPFMAAVTTDEEDSPVLEAISSGKLQEGYNVEWNRPERTKIDKKYKEDLDDVIEQTGGNPDYVDSSIKRILRDVGRYRSATARTQATRTFVNPDGSKVSHEEIYGAPNLQVNVGNQMLNNIKKDGNFDLIKNVSEVIERLDSLNEKEYDGFLNLTKDLASEFSVDNTPAENFKILKNLDTSELKKYREKMGLSKEDLLDLIVPPDGTSPWLEKLMNVGKKTLGKFKDF
tara:strand:- start:271 stop:978 length:708 start_codon:yes stop_codon:yes gene_type:complete